MIHDRKTYADIQKGQRNFEKIFENHDKTKAQRDKRELRVTVVIHYITFLQY